MFSAFKKILNIVSKVFLVLAVYTVVINLFIYFTSQNKIKLSDDPIKKNRNEIYRTLHDKNLNSTKQGKQMVAIYRAGMCGLIGEACTDNPNDGDKNYNYSVFGYLSKLIVFPYANPPASGVYWAYNSLQGAGFIPKTYAAEGIGFAALKPLIDIWKIFRDVAYILLVIILLTIGFMIMFRLKINPQTVISLENALPRIVLTLIIITFSFAIAGFLIDLMYLTIGLGISVFGKHVDVVAEQAKALGRGSSLWDDVFANGQIWQVGQALFNILPNEVGATLRTILAGFGWYFLTTHLPVVKDLFSGNIAKDVATTGGFLKTVIELLLWTFSGPLLFLFAPLILSLFVFLTALFIFFRLFFLLFKSYLMIILLTLFSPIILIFHAIPGQNIFFKWIRNIVSHLIAFPMVVVLLIVSSLIVNISSTGGKFWAAPFLYSPDAGAFSVLVGVGLLFLIPDLIKAVREAMGIKPSPLNIGAGLFFGGIGGVGQGGARALSQFGSLAFGLGPLIRAAGAPKGKRLQELFQTRGHPTTTQTTQTEAGENP